MGVHRLTALSICCAMLVCGQAYAEANISTKRTPDGFVIRLSGVTGGDERIAQEMIGPTATRLCGNLVPEFGKFRLDAQIAAAPGKALKPGKFVQEIRCVKPVDVVLPTTATLFTPSADDDAQARNQALRFLMLRDSGDTRGSYDMLGSDMKAQQTPDEWAKLVAALPRELGSPPERRIAKVTWYVDPPGIDSGVYAAADFGGRSRNVVILCGYVVLKRLDDRNYAVVRTEEGRLKATDATGMSPEKLAEMRVALRCRD